MSLVRNWLVRKLMSGGHSTRSKCIAKHANLLFGYCVMNGSNLTIYICTGFMKVS